MARIHMILETLALFLANVIDIYLLQVLDTSYCRFDLYLIQLILNYRTVLKKMHISLITEQKNHVMTTNFTVLRKNCIVSVASL